METRVILRLSTPRFFLLSDGGELRIADGNAWYAYLPVYTARVTTVEAPAKHLAPSLRYVTADDGEGSEDTEPFGTGKGEGTSRIPSQIPDVICLTNMECAQRGHMRNVSVPKPGSSEHALTALGG